MYEKEREVIEMGKRVGFIGLGIIDMPMAHNLIKAGREYKRLSCLAVDSTCCTERYFVNLKKALVTDINNYSIVK